MIRYRAVPTGRFKKDMRRLRKAGYDLAKLTALVALLEQDLPLPAHYRDHALHGAMQGVRACHIAPDWLLLYKRNTSELLLTLVSTGDHRRTLGIE